MRTILALPLLPLLALLAPSAWAQDGLTKESLYGDLEAEHRQYDTSVKKLQEELNGVVRTIKEILEPAGGPDALNVAPRTPEQEKALADAQARAQTLVDQMLEEEFRHRRRTLELLDGGRELLRAELSSLFCQGKVPTGTLRDLLLPAGTPRVEVAPVEGGQKPKSLFDEKDEEDETLE